MNLQAITDVIVMLRAGKIMPSGNLYAQLMNRMSLSQYNDALSIVKSMGLVKEGASHLLTWTDPIPGTAPERLVNGIDAILSASHNTAHQPVTSINDG